MKDFTLPSSKDVFDYMVKDCIGHPPVNKKASGGQDATYMETKLYYAFGVLAEFIRMQVTGLDSDIKGSFDILCFDNSIDIETVGYMRQVCMTYSDLIESGSSVRCKVMPFVSKGYFIPECIQNNEDLKSKWVGDMELRAEYKPLGMNVLCVEYGTVEDFESKYKEV